MRLDFEKIVENALDLIIFVDLTGKIIFINSAVVKTFNYSRSELIGQRFFKFVPKRSLAKSKKVFSTLVNGKNKANFEFPIHQKNHSERIMSFSAKLVKEKGKFVGVIISGRDVTEKKNAEKSLMESESKFRNIIDSSPFGMHMYELKGKNLIFTGANPAADKILSLNNKQFIGKTIEEAFPPLKNTEVPKSYKAAAKNGVGWETEQINYQHGKISGAFSVKAFQTEPNKMVAVFIDITSRKKAEARLLESEERYRLTVENVGYVLYSFNSQYQVDFVSDKINEFGFKPKDFYNDKKMWLKMMHPEDVEQQSKEFFKFVKSRNVKLAREYRIVKSKKTYWMRDILVKSIDENGKIKKFYGYLLDITNRKKAEKELEKRINELESFQKFSVGRELKMVELKEKLREFQKK